MTEPNNEEPDEKYFVKFYLHPDGEGNFNIEMNSGLPTDRHTAMEFMGMLSQINMGECSDVMLDNITLESRMQHNELFQEIAYNWNKELQDRQILAAKSPKSVVSPLRVFGASKL